MDVNKKDGSSYKKNGLISIRYGIARHVKLTRGMDILLDPKFSTSNEIFNARMAELKRAGFGKVEHFPPISDSDLLKLYSGFCDITENPLHLVEKVQFDLMFYLCRRGRENLRQMGKDHFQVGI